MKKLTVTQAAKKIDAAAEKWLHSSTRKKINQVTTTAAKRLSHDPIFNAAAYMKYDFPSMFGLADSQWLGAAEEINSILKGKTK